MATVADLIKAAQGLGADDFLKLQTALERVEERLWDGELRRASARQRKEKLTDAVIDDLAPKRRRSRAR
ncbi:MAG TPA: hypothetical protein VMS17_27650 [Gemmataceae bacterium]|nr:hypothetical protein [Gemmataceae bacterium]